MRRPLPFALIAGLVFTAPQAAAQDTTLVVHEIHGVSSVLARALAFPFDVALLPVRVIGDGLDAGLEWVEDRAVIARLSRLLLEIEPVKPRFGGLGEHSGAGPGLQLDLGDRRGPGLSGRLEANITTPGYQLHAGTIRYRPSHGVALLATAAYKLDTQDEFYGVGTTSAVADRSDYRLSRWSAGVGVGWSVGPRLSVEAWAEWRRESTARGRNDLLPDVADRFAAALPSGFGASSTYLRPSLRLLWDGRRSTTRGVAGAWASAEYAYDVGLDGGDPRFHELDLEARGFAPLGGLRRTLALRARVELRREERGETPFFHLAAVGGSRNLRAFRANRFRDRDGILLTAEYRYRIWRDDRAANGMDVVLFADDGAVVRDLFADLEAGSFHGGYGVGLRLSRQDVVGRIEVAHGREGTRIQLRAGPLF